MSEEGIIAGAMKKVFLAGVGAVAVTADKSEEIFNDLVEKGASTVEHGKAMNQELKHNVKERAEERKARAREAGTSDNPIRDLNAILAGMTAEQLDALKGRIDEAEAKVKKTANDAATDDSLFEEKKDS
jgi:polyhydroxyalkanoate synthesis regulator phasin